MMPFSDEQVALLEAEIDRDRIKGRKGPSGRNLSYLSQDDVKRAANKIIGYGKWSYKPLDLTHLGTEPVVRERTVEQEDGQNTKVTDKGSRVAYRATVEVSFTGSDAVYVDVGYGEDVSYSDTVLQQHELATKEAVSDAFKRAMVALGDQFGLSLYAEAAAMRQEGGRGRKRRDNETNAPPVVSQKDLAAIHAERTKFDVSEEDLHRLARFVSQMPNLVSMKELPRWSKANLIDALRYYASNPEDAERQMQEAETNATLGLESQAEAAGIPDGYH